MSLFLFRRYTFKTEKREKILTALINSGIEFSSPKKEEEGISFNASFFKKSQIEELSKKWGVAFEYENKGIISRLFFLKKRLGLILGGVSAFFLIYLSTFFVWSVKIEGNENLSKDEIKRIMAECGFHEGVRKSSIDVNELQNEVLSRCHELSFFSVNIHGMVADVVVHERRVEANPVKRGVPYNLIADFDGVVVAFLVLDGQTMVKVGDTVTKGELLVSGIMDSTSEGYRLRQADGKVYAKTYRALEFSTPLEYYEKQMVRQELSQKIRILGHSIGRSVGKGSEEYDLSFEESEFKLFNVSFPLSIETYKASYYTPVKVSVSEPEARAKLLDDYKKYISTELDSASVLSERLTYTQNEEKITLTAELTAIENIAVKEKININ